MRADLKESFDMLHFDDIVFGPIKSRRLGSSLGVNILPSKGKLCNFDCVYCECGWNKDGISDRKFPDFNQVREALEGRISSLASKGVVVDSISLKITNKKAAEIKTIKGRNPKTRPRIYKTKSFSGRLGRPFGINIFSF